MSALDQAFIKAFAKEPAVAPARSMPVPATREAHVPSEPVLFDELYDSGTFYRVDSACAESAVPAAHIAPERKVPRRLQRRSAARAEFDIALPMQPEPMPVAPPVPVPPRRNWSRSMLEIARQLAQFDLLQKDEGEVPPELVAIDPPGEDKPVVAPAASTTSAATKEDVELPPSTPQTIAQLWPVDAPVMTQSIVALADAQTWLAQPIAPAVTCHENLTDWAQLGAKDIAAEPPAPADSDLEQAAKKKRKLRIDASHPRIPRPHRVPEVSVAAEQPPAVEKPNVEPVVEQSVVAESAPAVVQEPAAIQSPAEVLLAEVASAPLPEAPPKIISTTIPKRPYVPLWEVDRFTWPPLCDKLMNDQNGYFASASNKLLSVVRGGLKVLGVTGSRRGEGRTTLALCLARAAAQAGIHVALVDADFARPQLAATLGLETAYGWQEAATGKIPLSEAAVKSLADRLTVLPLEVSTTEAPLSLRDPRVTATLRATAATFELVVVDLGPLSSSNEALFPDGEPCPLDAAIVVRDSRFATVNESRLVGDRLYDAGIEAVGIAENFVTQSELAFL